MKKLSSHLKFYLRLILLMVVSVSGMSCAALPYTTQAPSRPAPVFVACSVAQQAGLEQALSDADGLALNAYQVLSGMPESQRASSTRYQEWFGSYAPANYAVVTANYQHISAAFASQTITFTCGCPELLFAFVNPGQPYQITLCASFWNAPETGTNSRAGTLVHEMSHFTVVAGTVDHVYSQVFSRANARYIPAKAIQNADSYRYFAENDPQLEPRMPALQ